MAETGRPRDPVWEYFSRHPIGEYFYGKCLVCEQHVAGKPHLLLKHLPVCVNQPQEVRSWATKLWEEWRVSNRKQKADSPKSQSPDSNGKQARFTVSSFPRVGIVEQIRLEGQIMRFFAACNIPFSVVQHPEFVNLMQLLRGPTFQPPERPRLSAELLLELYMVLQKEYYNDIRDGVGTLSLDGWSARSLILCSGWGSSVSKNTVFFSGGADCMA